MPSITYHYTSETAANNVVHESPS